MNSQQRRPRFRRGVAYVLILGLVSITMALSYAMMRSTVTGTLVQDNVSRLSEARLAAHAGANIAMRAMGTTSWGGVGSTLSGSLGNNQTYSVTFTAGDPSLDTSTPSTFLTDATKLTSLLNRVTILSTGTAADAAGQYTATYKVQTVMELVRRRLADTPTRWSETQNYTVYQQDSSNASMSVDFPLQITGPARIGSTAQLMPGSPTSYSLRNRYLTDLVAWTSSLGHDARPFTNNVDIDTHSNNQDFRNLLAATGISSTNVSTTPTVAWSAPGAITTYRLYPGGPTYNAYQITTSTITGSSSSSTPTLAPTLENPLGIYHRVGSLTLGNDAWVQGTIVLSGGTSSDLNVTGARVRIEAVNNVLGLSGTNPTSTESLIQLPIVDISGSVRVQPGASATLSGTVIAASQFRVVGDDRTDIDFLLNGRVIAKDFIVESRSDWVKSSSWWNLINFLFGSSSSTNFPSYVYLADNSMWPDPWSSSIRLGQIRLGPPVTSAATIVYARKDSGNTIYVADPNDIENTGETGALRWSVVRWSEGNQ